MDHILKLYENGCHNHEFYSEIYQSAEKNSCSAKIQGLIACITKRRDFKKDLLYLILLVHDDVSLLNELIENEHLILDFDHRESIFNYCMSNQHWILNIIKNGGGYDFISHLSENVNVKLRIIQIIENFNKNTSYEALQNLNSFCTLKENGLFDLFLKIIKRAKNIIEISKDIEENIDINELLLLCCQNSLLEVFSNCLDFNNVKLWDSILAELDNSHDEMAKTVFRCFIVIYSLISSLKLCKNVKNSNFEHKDVISTLVEKAKQCLLEFSSLKWQTILLENIFALLFLRNGGNEFFCNENEVRLLLTFLRTCIDEIKLKHLYNRSSKNVQKINELSKYVTDAFWRFELVIRDDAVGLSVKKDIISRMLASPEALLNLILKQGNFIKAKQIIEMFSLHETTLAKDTLLSEQLDHFKKIIRQALKKKSLARQQALSPEPNLNVLVTDFIKSNASFFNTETCFEELNDEETTPILKHFSLSNNKFMNVLDLAMIQPDNYESSEELLNIAVSYNTLSTKIATTYSEFCKNLVEIFHSVNDRQQAMFSIKDILLKSEIDLDFKIFFQELDAFSRLSNATQLFMENLYKYQTRKIEAKHLNKCFLQIQTICMPTKPNQRRARYFMRLLNYLKALYKIFSINQNRLETIVLGENSNLFELLKHSRIEIIKILIAERKVDPSDFESLFTKMKLDLVYHVAASYFPFINVSNENKSFNTIILQQKPTKFVLSYVQKRNWLLAFLLRRIHSLDNTPEVEISKVRIKHYTNFSNLSRIQFLKVVFENNEALAVLHNKINQQLIEHFCQRAIVRNDLSLMGSEISSGSLETGEEIMEGKLRNTDWKYLFNIVQSLTEKQFKQNSELACLRDNILFNLVSDRFENNSHEYVKYIKEDRLRQNCIKNNFKYWPGPFCIEVMKNEILMYKDDNEEMESFKTWCKQISFCEKMNSYLQVTSWAEVFQLCETSPEFVLRQLLNPPEIDLLLEFVKTFKPIEDLLININEFYFSKLFIYEIDFKRIKEVFDILPSKYGKSLFTKLFDCMRKMEHLEFLMSYLSDIDDSSETIKNIKISLKILSCLDESEREQFWCLIREPLCILEVLVMNTKLEKLGQVINAIRKSVNECSPEESISWEKIDSLLRTYAEKSLDFRVVVQSKRPTSLSENKLLESLDSSLFGTYKSDFLIPDDVPTKTEWVKNEEVSECMCCMETTFSMFSRRHHCRRCGRVICGSCSTKRMLVPTYGDIRVRVCKDCYQQTFYDSPSNYSVASVKSIDYDYWQLTDYESHNIIVREEFSFEHAPSVYLCLAILKYHSINDEYTKFLLDQCHSLLKLLYPIPTELTQEIDYFLVIKMLKSLAIAAKLQSFHSGHEGSALADRIISQADLLELLIERGCLHLIPHNTSNLQNPYIDTSTIRRLRDKLLEDEQWNLALEVSTKAGLDNTGVFAAWGKSCLKAGSLKWAREKFQRCFDKTSYYENSMDFSCSLSECFGSNKRQTHFSGSIVYENKPSRNPPLLNEIIEILEGNNCKVDHKFLKDVASTRQNCMMSSTMSIDSNNTTLVSSQIDSAVCILSKLHNLNKIIDGEIFESNTSIKTVDLAVKKAHLDQVFYEECVYYLFRYGSHMGLLDFYIRHEQIEEALQYILEYHLSPEIFIEVYTLCLKDGNIKVFHEKMSKLDSTLDAWKDYLRHLCRQFEQQSMLHSLYQLQQFTGDYVRAALTCIKFYKDAARSYLDLKSKIDFLQKAQDHLKQELEQEQWVEVATVRKSSSSSQHSFEAKSITNPSLVMKIDSKSIDRHINTIWRQMEVTKFLAECEINGTEVMKLLPEILPFAEKETTESKNCIPTLFGSYYEKVQLAVLCIICGTNIEDGFGIAFRIIQDYKLNSIKVYCQAGKQLAKTERYSGLAQLVNCIRSSGVNDTTITDMCDEMLILAIQTLTKANVTGPQLDGLIKLITDRSAKISAYIEAKQLKSAYLLAVKHKRMADIRKILKEAEYLNQPTIKALCQKILQVNSHLPSHSKD